jgi:hypothetical protein
MFCEHFSNMVNTHQKHVKCFICKRNLFDENRLESHSEPYHPLSIIKGLIPDGIEQPAGWVWPEPSWLDFSHCTRMAINMLSQLIHLPIDNVSGTPPPEYTPDTETTDPQMPNLTCTPDSTKTRAHRQVGGVENVGGKAYGKATRLYNKHCKFPKQWSPWHPFQSADDIQLAQSYSQ